MQFAGDAPRSRSCACSTALPSCRPLRLSWVISVRSLPEATTKRSWHNVTLKNRTSAVLGGPRSYSA